MSNSPEEFLAQLKLEFVKGLHDLGFPTVDTKGLTEVYDYRAYCISALKKTKEETGYLAPIAEAFLAELEFRQARKYIVETSAPLNRVVPSRATSQALATQLAEIQRHAAQARLCISNRKSAK